MKSRLIALGAALATLTATVFLAASPAAAQPAEETLDGLRAAVTARIDMRLAALNKDAVTVDNARALSEAHRAHLSALIDEAVGGLTGLKAQVAQRTTVAELRADARSMVEDYRAYALVGPQVRLAVAGDLAAAAIDRARQIHDRLSSAVAQKKADGADTAAAEADLAQMQSAIDAAARELNGAVDALLAVEPGPDAAAIRSAVTTARAAIASTRSQLRTAVAEGRAVLAFLRP
jgi:hypothetical protein